ncbi:MAG: hypothetical protein ACM3KD_01055 [Hyphomicrobiaceae bacterium]
MNWKILDGRWMQSGRQAAPDATRLTEAEAEIPSRRAVLRGALVAGCSLLLPASLLGCSKKETSTAGTEPAVPSPEAAAPPENPAPMESAAPSSPAPMESAAPSGQAPMESAAPAAPAKMSQASVKYQTEPKGDQQCSNCLHFIPPNACKLVEGNISPTAWCILWTKKA